MYTSSVTDHHNGSGQGVALVGAGAWRTMYSSDTISDSDTPGHRYGETVCSRATAETNANEKSTASTVCKSSISTITGTRCSISTNTGTSCSIPTTISIKSLYSRALTNDDIVIVETSPCAPRPQKPDVYRNGGGQADRAGRTLRGLSDEELPHPDVVRRAKTIFETLSKKQRQEGPLKRHQSSAQDIVKPGPVSSGLGRSRSMQALSNGHGARTSRVLKNNAYNRPSYQRSCSELDKFFQEEEDDDDLWERHARADRGSPVSPEAIQKIRDQGTCVQFFGSDAYVVDTGDNEDMSDEAFLEERAGYLLEYPYELYPSDDKPTCKIIGSVPKTSSGSCGSSMSSAYGGRETPSPAPPSPYGGHNGWIIGGCGVSLDDIRASLKLEDSEGSRASSSLGSGYVRLKQPCHGPRLPMAFERSHGKWMKNPFWQGSYYVIYDFTQKVQEPVFHINGN